MLVLALLACQRGPGLLSDGDGDGAPAVVDCDDGDARRAPGRDEVPTDGVDQDCDGVDAVAAGARVGASVDEGFGFAVAVAGDRLVIGAPFYAEGGRAMGRVWVEEADGRGAVALTGAPGERLGAGIVALDSGELRIGAPGAGEVRDGEGAVVAEGLGMGGALTARGERWAGATRDGARRDDGSTEAWGAQPAALALGAGGVLAGGFPRSEAAVRVDGRTLTAAVGTETGYALLFADLDGDGVEELIVGAPGEGAVYVLPAGATALGDGARLTGEGGRFGAALAAHDGALFVGAPLHEGHGRVWRIAGGGAPEVWADGADGEQLGATLLATERALVIGAPGAMGLPGAVRVVPF